MGFFQEAGVRRWQEQLQQEQQRKQDRLTSFVNLWDDQAGYLPPPSSPDGPGATEAQVAFYCTSTLGFWPFRRSLEEMPAEFGDEFFALCRSCVPYQVKLLEQIVERLTTG